VFPLTVQDIFSTFTNPRIGTRLPPFRSMSQLEIFPPASRIRGILKIRLLRLLRHAIPLTTPHPIPPNVIHLHQTINNNVHDTESDQCLVALPVQRSVVLSIDVGDDDPADLNEHVVQGRTDRPGPDGIGVPTAPSHLYGVGGWEREQNCDDGVASPGRCHGRQGCQGDHVGEDPKLCEGADSGALVEVLGEESDEEHLRCVRQDESLCNGFSTGGATYRYSASDLTGNRKQICSEGIESQVPQSQSQILIWRSSRELEHKADDVDWPEVVVFHRQPQTLEIDSLPVVHVSLRRIVSQDPIDYDYFFSLGEPALRSEPGLCLSRRGSHCKPGPDAYGERDAAFDQEEPSPTGQAVQTSHAQDAESQDGCDDVDDAESHPEQCKSEG
jgi:hypothetical protein